MAVEDEDVVVVVISSAAEEVDPLGVVSVLRLVVLYASVVEL